jgi:DNA-binding NtrC family response regulator
MAMDRGASVTNAESVLQAISVMRVQGADLVMIEVSLPVQQLVDGLAADRIRTPVVACGIGTDASTAANAIRAGAREFIPLPPDPELIAAILAAVSNPDESLIYRDPEMEKIVRLAETVARSEASILITGESGTGKEVIARHIHRRSNRSKRPFISVNCAAIPEGLMESELFGHERGAFTGAVARRIGKFEEANGGTLLLDEISEMDVRLQAKLLRAIQERVIDRVGGSSPVPVDIRILATSNRNLREEAFRGRFREDLYYRLNVVNIQIPPLRERPQDIIALAGHFATYFSELNGLSKRTFSPDAKRALLSNAWKGNVRELENVVHRAVLISRSDEIGNESIILQDSTGNMPFGQDLTTKAAQTAEAMTRGLVGRTVSEVEKRLIIDTLDHCLGNRTHAAKILGISIRTLRNKLNEYVADGTISRELSDV